MRDVLSDRRQEGIPDRWERMCKTPERDRGQVYKFVSLIVSIAHATEQEFLMNRGISHAKILLSSLFKHLLELAIEFIIHGWP